MTAIDPDEPVERDAREKAASEQPGHDERQDTEPTDSSVREREDPEDPFALDPLGPPSGRPW